MNKHKTLGGILFDGFNYAVLSLYAVLAIIPLVYVFSGSFSSAAEIAQKGFVIVPTKPVLSAYQYIFSTSSVTQSLMVSIYVTALGTIVNMIFTSLTAYPLADKELEGRKVLMTLVTFTMVFNAGMVPTYLMVRSLGLMNSLWALMVPSAISTWNLIVLKNFFQQIPNELKESAKIDGCNDLAIFIRIALPLSTPALATFSLFYAVGNWNAFFAAMLYINDSKKWPIQIILRQVVMMAQQIGNNEDFTYLSPPSETVKMAVIVMATLPILLVYPFLQKHFVKGVMLGSIKG